MLINNGKRLAIWQNLKNKFDYNEMVAECIANDAEIMGAIEFAQKIGIILCAEAMYPDLPTKDAAVKFVTEFNSQVVHPVVSASVATKMTAGCCGGGQVK